MYHISEIIEGWEKPPWVVDDPVAAGSSVVDEPGPTDWDGQRWRVVAAGALVACLVAALFLVGRSTDEEAGRALTATSAWAAPASTFGAVTADAVIADARRALDGWGRFAVTGDLAVVEHWFAADGPQLEQLRSEAPEVAAARIGGAPYEFELTEPVLIEGDARTQVIHAGVAVSRPGEIVQRYRWAIEMHRPAGDGRWQLWTVKSAD